MTTNQGQGLGRKDSLPFLSFLHSGQQDPSSLTSCLKVSQPDFCHGQRRLCLGFELVLCFDPCPCFSLLAKSLDLLHTLKFLLWWLAPLSPMSRMRLSGLFVHLHMKQLHHSLVPTKP